MRTVLFLLLILSAACAFGADEPHLRIARALAALGPHPYGSEAGEKAANYILNEFRSYGISDARLVTFLKPQIGFNVVATIPGKDASKEILITSHHDSVPAGPGAYDDGGGTAVMMNVARHFTTMQPPYTLVFVSFDAEEHGLEGSIAFAKSLSEEDRASILYHLCLEMMGWQRGSPNLQTIRYENGGRNPKSPLLSGAGILTPHALTKLIMDSALEAKVSLDVGDPYLSPLYQPEIRMTKVNFYGDDASLLLAGVPAVMLTDSSFSAFYPYYHTAKDVPENLSESRLADMTKLVLAVVHRSTGWKLDGAIESKQEQEYLRLGPVDISYPVLAVFYLLTLVFLAFTLVRKYLQSPLTLILLIEILFVANIFNHYAVFAACLFGVSIWLYLICEWLGWKHPVRIALIYLPHLAILIFALEATREGFLYGTYLHPVDRVFMAVAIALSFVRVHKLPKLQG